MDDNAYPIVNKNFISESFENEILLYTESDTKAVYLNETAYLVWKMCEDRKRIGDIITLLEETYPDQQEQIRPDVLEALRTLSEIGAVSFTDEA